MIGKAKVGANFGGLQNYLLSGQRGTELKAERVAEVETRNLPLDDPDQAAKVMHATAAQNPLVRVPVYHLTINPPPESGLTHAQLMAVGHRALEELGLGEHQALLAIHHDATTDGRSRPHLHIMVNSVHPETLRVYDRRLDWRRIDTVLDRIGLELGLPPVPRREAPERTPGYDFSDNVPRELALAARRRGVAPLSVRSREAVRPVLMTASSWSEVDRRLAAYGLWLEARGRGLVVANGRETAKASSFGREVSGPRLEARLGESFAVHRERRPALPDALAFRNWLEAAFDGSESPVGVLRQLADDGSLARFLPEVLALRGLEQDPERYAETDALEHTFAVVERTPPEFRWEALLHDIGKPSVANLDPSGAFFQFPGHGNAGVKLLPEIAQRLYLPDARARSVEAVIDHHAGSLELWAAPETPSAAAVESLRAQIGPHTEAVKAVVLADRFGRESLDEDLVRGMLGPSLTDKAADQPERAVSGTAEDPSERTRSPVETPVDKAPSDGRRGEDLAPLTPLDVALTEAGYAADPLEARQLVLDGAVELDGDITRDPDTLLSPGRHPVAIRSTDHSRAGDLRVADPFTPSRSPEHPLSERVDGVVERLGQRHAVFSETALRAQTRWDEDPKALLEAVRRSPQLIEIPSSSGQRLFTTEAAVAREARLVALGRALAGDVGVSSAEETGSGQPAHLADLAKSTGVEPAVLRSLTGPRLAAFELHGEESRRYLNDQVATASERAELVVIPVAATAARARQLEERFGRAITLFGAGSFGVAERLPLDSRTLMLVEDCERIGQGPVADLLDQAWRSGARVVLVGAPAHERPITAGDAFLALSPVTEPVRLGHGPRREDDWRREALTALRAGRAHDALAAYDEVGRVFAGDDLQQAIQAVVHDWQADRFAEPGRVQAAVAFSRKRRERLNAAIHVLRERAGELGRSVELAGRSVAIGERVVFTRGDRHGLLVDTVESYTPERGVSQGSVGTVTEASADRVVIALDAGRTVSVDPHDWTHLDYAYALAPSDLAEVSPEVVYLLADPYADGADVRAALAAADGNARLYLSRSEVPRVEALAHGWNATALGDSIQQHVPDLVDTRARSMVLPDRDAARIAWEAETQAERSAAGALLGQIEAERAVWTRHDLARLAQRSSTPPGAVAWALRSPDVRALRTDGSGWTWYTTERYLEREHSLFAHAQALVSSDAGPRLERATVERLLEEHGGRLSAEQRDTFRWLARDQRLTLATGYAGTGKTRLFERLGEAYRAQGYAVVGMAPTGAAAERLGETAGIPARTIDSYLASWSRDADTLSRTAVVVLDEAGMVDTERMEALLRHADETGAKVIAVGDTAQLPPVGAGEPFRGLVAEHGAPVLEDIRRQTDRWQQEASLALASGRGPEAILAYEEHGRLRWHATRHESLERLAEDLDRSLRGEPERSHVALAYRNRDVQVLNERIRRLRAARGELGESLDVAVVRRGVGERGGPDGGSDTLSVAVGDHVVFTRNDPHERAVHTVNAADDAARGVRNGTFGVVAHVSPGAVRVELPTGRTVEFEPGAWQHLDHAYALTIHRAQGLSAERVAVVPDRAMSKELAYTALTRHRETLSVYVDRETFADVAELAAAVSRKSPPDLARDHVAIHEVERAVRSLAAGRQTSEALRSAETELRRVQRVGDTFRHAVDAQAGAFRDLHLELKQVFRDPSAAQAALAVTVSRDGLAAAEKALARPESLGELRAGVDGQHIRRHTAAAVAALERFRDHHAIAVSLDHPRAVPGKKAMEVSGPELGAALRAVQEQVAAAQQRHGRSRPAPAPRETVQAPAPAADGAPLRSARLLHSVSRLAGGGRGVDDPADLARTAAQGLYLFWEARALLAERQATREPARPRPRDRAKERGAPGRRRDGSRGPDAASRARVAARSGERRGPRTRTSRVATRPGTGIRSLGRAEALNAQITKLRQASRAFESPERAREAMGRAVQSVGLSAAHLAGAKGHAVVLAYTVAREMSRQVQRGLDL